MFILLIMVTTCGFSKPDDSVLVNLPADYWTQSDLISSQNSENQVSKQDKATEEVREINWSGIIDWIFILGITIGFVCLYKQNKNKSNTQDEEKTWDKRHKFTFHKNTIQSSFPKKDTNPISKHRYGGHCGVNPATGLPLRSRGVDIGGHARGSRNSRNR